MPLAAVVSSYATESRPFARLLHLRLIQTTSAITSGLNFLQCYAPFGWFRHGRLHWKAMVGMLVLLGLVATLVGARSQLSGTYSFELKPAAYRKALRLV